MKSYLMPRSNKEYICHWCEVGIPPRSPYVKFRRYYRTLHLHIACSKQLVQRGWLWELDLTKLGRSSLDSSSEDSAWQEYIDGELSQHDTPTIR